MPADVRQQLDTGGVAHQHGVVLDADEAGRPHLGIAEPRVMAERATLSSADQSGTPSRARISAA